MKSYDVNFKRVFKDFNNKSNGAPTKKTIEVYQKVDANTFKEARDIIREQHTDAMSIDIKEIPDSFRGNTPEEAAAFIDKYSVVKGFSIGIVGRGANKLHNLQKHAIKEHLDKEANDILKDEKLVIETVLKLVSENDAVKQAVMKELIFVPADAIAVEDKIKAILTTANLIDYREEFIVKFTFGHIDVEQIDLRSHSSRVRDAAKKELAEEVRDDVREEVIKELSQKDNK